MKRLALAVLLTGLAAGVVALGQRLERNGRYRGLIADGEQALAGGQTYRAIESFSGALALRPDSMVAHFRRGEAYREQSQDDRALADLRAAARLAPEAPEPLVALGELYDKRGEPGQAAHWYEQAALRLEDADAVLLYRWALALYTSGAPAAAREPLRRALARDDSLARAHYLLGLVQRDAQDTDEAIQSLQRAVRLMPTLVAAREELAELYGQRGRATEEINELNAIRELDHTPDRDIAIALAHIRQTRFDEADAVLEAARAAAPADSRVALARARLLLARAERYGDKAAVNEALAVLDRALGGTARRSEGLALFGRALFLSGDAAGAERILLEAIATSPLDPEAFGFLADAAERLRHPAVARDALLDLDALEGDTVSPTTRAHRARRIGALSLAAGEPRAALAALTRATASGIADATTLGLVAEARWLTGDRDGARLALTDALRSDPRNPLLSRLERLISLR